MRQRRTPPVRVVWAILTVVLAALAGPVSWSVAAGQEGAPAATTTARRVNLNFTEAAITDVATALSIQSGVNVALSQSVKGSITVRLVDMPLDEALQRVASIVGADVRQFGNTYFVGGRAELKGIAANTGVTRTWAPHWSNAEDLKGLLEPAFPYLTVDASKSNHLILKGDPADVQAALEMAMRTDIQPAAQPPALTRETYTAKVAKVTDLVGQVRAAYPEVQFQVVDRAIVMSGQQAAVAQVARLFESLDQPRESGTVARTYRLKYLHPKQAADSLTEAFKGLTVTPGPEHYGPRAAQLRTISVEAQGVFGQGGGSGGGGSQQSADPSELQLAGAGSKARYVILTGPSELVDAALQLLADVDVAPEQVLIEARVVDVSPEKLREVGLQYEWSPFSFSFPGSEESSSAGKFGKLARGAFDFDMVLNLMEERREAKLLANPKIAVLDSEEASIFIGDLLRFRVLASITTGGQQEFTVKEVPVGIALLVRPRVNTGGEITLKVHPTVSTVTGFVGPERIPQTASREADSTIRVKDGETVVIGGLLRDEEVRTMSKVPGLGDLPVLGYLFRNKRTDRRKSEITVFLTTRLLH
ncbi:MAG: hypothetical protein HY320_01905 [Armatimonadetes bacterium]|nr:hypothetical protein [Armatimonadota bacterium]